MSAPSRPKTRLTVLDFKEPVFWPVQSGIAPYHVDGFLQRFPTKYVFMFRHPYDVIASGRRRAEQTTTWPSFTIDEHARLWISSFQLEQHGSHYPPRSKTSTPSSATCPASVCP